MYLWIPYSNAINFLATEYVDAFLMLSEFWCKAQQISAKFIFERTIC